MAFYVVPSVGTGTVPDPIRPKYDTEGLLPKYSGSQYGYEGAWLVWSNTSPAQHAALQAETDVIVVPPLDQQIGAALTAVQNRLAALRYPFGWVTATHTYRDVLRAIRKMNVLAQAFQELFPVDRIFAAGITVSTRMNQMTAAQRQRLSAAAERAGLDVSGVTNTMTLGTVLKLLGDQLPDKRVKGENL